MSDKQKAIDPIPEEFSTYEEAADFWDSHDTTAYPESFETVAVETELRQRHFEIEIPEDLMKALSKQARERGLALSQLVDDLLREKTRPAA